MKKKRKFLCVSSKCLDDEDVNYPHHFPIYAISRSAYIYSGVAMDTSFKSKSLLSPPQTLKVQLECGECLRKMTAVYNLSIL